MRRKIPSTVALAAFESAARHQSFTKAAHELSVTQSAVCRQIGVLEDLLGVKLFRRSKRGVTLTEAGAGYARSVRARLDEMERDTLELMANGAQGTSLDLAVVPTFATNWLLPRLAGFRRAHPHIMVNLTASTRPFLFEDTAVDAAIYAGEASWPGTQGHFLMRENLIAVASPALIAPRKALTAAQLARLPLLQQSTRPHAWRDWFQSQGLEVENDLAGPRLELFSMLARAAIHGMGVSLIPKFLVERELETGSLVQVVDHDYLSDRSYYLIHPQRKGGDRQALAAFREWIELEARQYREPMGLG
ncbi:MAG: LysR substrate-binding domain-containing protein [Ramlibacter sp.]